MPIRITCPHCQAVYNLADEYRGKKVRCTKCQQVIAIDQPSQPKRKEPEDIRPMARTDGGPSRPPRPGQDAIQARPGSVPPPPRRAVPVTAPARKAPVADKRGLSPVLIALGALATLLVIVGVAIPAVWFLWPRQERSVATNPQQQGQADNKVAGAPAAETPRDNSVAVRAPDPAGDGNPNALPAADPSEESSVAIEPAPPAKSVPSAKSTAPTSARLGKVDLSRFRLKLPPGYATNAPYGWRLVYEKDQNRLSLYTGDRPPNVNARLYVDQLPAKAPTKVADYADKLMDKDFQDPGFRYLEITEKSELPDGFLIKGKVKNLTDKNAKPEIGFVMVRDFQGAKIRLRSVALSDDGIGKEAVELFKTATLNTWPCLSLPAPSGWVMTPDNVTLIVSLADQAQLVYFDTVAAREIKRVEVDFKPGALAIHGKTLLAATQGSALVYALDLATGKVQKEFNLGDDAVAFLACHPSHGLIYATTNKFTVYSLDPGSGVVTKTSARGHFLAVDPVQGEFVYTGTQPQRQADLTIEGPRGPIYFYRDYWGPRAVLVKYAVQGKNLKSVSAQSNAAVNGWAMTLTPDGKRVMFVGGGGWRPNDEKGAGGGYVVAVYSTANLESMVGQAPHGLNVAFHPVLNLGVTNHYGLSLTVFNGKSLVKRTEIQISKSEERRPSILTFGGRGSKVILWNADNVSNDQGLHFIPLELSTDDGAALKRYYGRP